MSVIRKATSLQPEGKTMKNTVSGGLSRRMLLAAVAIGTLVPAGAMAQDELNALVTFLSSRKSR